MTVFVCVGVCVCEWVYLVCATVYVCVCGRVKQYFTPDVVRRHQIISTAAGERIRLPRHVRGTHTHTHYCLQVCVCVCGVAGSVLSA